jgi:hypothetical protein
MENPLPLRSIDTLGVRHRRDAYATLDARNVHPCRIYPGGIKAKAAWHEVPGKRRKTRPVPWPIIIFFVSISGKYPAAVAESCASRHQEEKVYGCSSPKLYDNPGSAVTVGSHSPRTA